MTKGFRDLRSANFDGEVWVSVNDLRTLLNNVIGTVALGVLFAEDTARKAAAVIICDTYEGLDKVLANV